MSDSAFIYRSATPSDAVACSDILHAWGGETPWMVPLFPPDPMAAFWAEEFTQDPAWVVERDGQIVGFCARSDDNVSGLYVTAGARGFGVGKALLDLAKADREFITVWSYEQNHRARAFYRREGLVEVRREFEIFDDGSRLMDVEHRWIRPRGTSPVAK